MNIQDKIDKYAKLEEEIIDDIGKLPNCGKECDCKTALIFRFIHEGEYPEIMTMCCSCGGYKDV